MMAGGRGQVNIALAVLEKLQLAIPVCGMVKDDKHRTRGLYFNNEEIPISRDSEGFKLITRIQDEACLLYTSGTIGENPNGIPNNLMPYITQVAVGKLKELGVFGNDYDTHDGTGVRDYIHVVDLAKGHVKALKKIEDNSGLSVYNLGTGNGYSVLDIVKNFEEATGVKIPYVIKPRRAGDIATCYSSADKAYKELGWKAENGIKEMCEDSWRWQSNNPNGYED